MIQFPQALKWFHLSNRNPAASHSDSKTKRFHPGTRAPRGTGTMINKQEELSSLDQGLSVVLQAGLQLLQDPAALLHVGHVPVWEGHVVDGEAPLLVDVQQGGHSVPVQLRPGAEHKDLLHPLVLELLWWEKTSNADASPQECVKAHDSSG